MLKHTEIIDQNEDEALTLKTGLYKLRKDRLALPVVLTFLFMVPIMPYRISLGFVIGSWLAVAIMVLTRDKKTIYIYRFFIFEGKLNLYLANIFGKTEERILAIDQIQKVKYKERIRPVMYVHFSDSVEALYFLDSGTGNLLIKELDVEKM